MRLNLKTKPTHTEWQVLRELSYNGHWRSTDQLAVELGISVNHCRSAIQSLKQLELVVAVDAVVDFEHPHELTALGRQALGVINKWHEQPWHKRLFGPPPPPI